MIKFISSGEILGCSKAIPAYFCVSHCPNDSVFWSLHKNKNIFNINEENVAQLSLNYSFNFFSVF